MSGDRNTEGVSVVIGAILILGLMVATTVTIQLNYVPIWEKDRQAAHMRLIESQLADLKSELDRQIDNRTNVPVAHPLALGVTDTGTFGRTTNEGTVTFHSGTLPFQVMSNRFLIQQEGEATYLGLQETWTGISGTVNLEDVGTIHSLRLRLASAVQHQAGDSVTITATDSSSAFAGDLRVLISAQGAEDWKATVRVRDAASDTVAEISSSFPNDQTQSPYWIDALRTDYRFDRIINAASRPVRLTLATANVDSGAGNQDLSAEYGITYQQSGTQIILGGGGLQRDNYATTYTGGLLQYHAENGRYPAQDYFLEHGGLILSQADGAAFRIQPTFQASLESGTTALALTIPTLVGTDAAHRSGETATLYTSSTDHLLLAGQAPRWTLIVTTTEPSLWTTLWTDELSQLPGFVQNTHYTTSTTATTATLNVYGLTSDPNSLTYDLHVTLRQAPITIDIKS